MSLPPPEPAEGDPRSLSAEEVEAITRQADAAWRREVVARRGPAPRVPLNAIAVVLLLLVGCITLLVVGHGSSGPGGTTTTSPARQQAPVTPAPPGPGLPPEFFG